MNNARLEHIETMAELGFTGYITELVAEVRRLGDDLVFAKRLLEVNMWADDGNHNEQCIECGGEVPHHKAGCDLSEFLYGNSPPPPRQRTSSAPGAGGLNDDCVLD